MYGLTQIFRGREGVIFGVPFPGILSEFPSQVERWREQHKCSAPFAFRPIRCLIAMLFSLARICNWSKGKYVNTLQPILDLRGAIVYPIFTKEWRTRNALIAQNISQYSITGDRYPPKPARHLQL